MLRTRITLVLLLLLAVLTLMSWQTSAAARAAQAPDGLTSNDWTQMGSQPSLEGAAIWDEQARLTAGDAAATDELGKAVAIDGDTAVISAYRKNENAGAVYIFIRDSAGNWSEQAKLTASDAAMNDRFGFAVAIQDDTAVIGAYQKDENAGAVYVFTRDSDGNWSEQAKLTADDAAPHRFFGEAVALHGDTAVIGAPLDAEGGNFSGAAYIFTRSNGSWSQQQKLTADDAAAGDFFGIALAVEGDTAVIGANQKNQGAGAAYVFTRDGSGSWSQQQTLIASDAAASDSFGFAVAMQGDTALIGAHAKERRGATYVFTRDSGGDWSQQQKLTASDAAEGDYFGYSVALDSDTAVIGADGNDDGGRSSGSAYVFTRDGSGSWFQQQKLYAGKPAAGDQFGFAVAVSGDTAVIGAPWKDGGDLSDTGAAYVYRAGSTTAAYSLRLPFIVSMPLSSSAQE